MDIYSFLNSKDIAEHCRKIGHAWTAFDMAVIIARSMRSIPEKHAAWREIIANYPDIPTPENMHYDSYESLHKKLEEVIDYEERVLALLKKPEAGAVYIHKVWWHKEWHHSNTIFTDYDSTFADALDDWTRDEINKIEIVKSFAGDIENNKGTIEVTVDYDGNPYWVSAYSSSALFPDIDFDNLLDDLYGSFYVDIPVQFKKGDILTNRQSLQHPKDEEDVFILDSVDRDDPIKQERRLRGEMSDGTDLMGYGYCVDDDDGVLGRNEGFYDHFEYYRGKLKGKDTLLYYVSLFIKGEIDIPELLGIQSRLMQKHQYKEGMRTLLHGRYLPEYLHPEHCLGKDGEEGT
jgi:hypothetical protein